MRTSLDFTRVSAEDATASSAATADSTKLREMHEPLCRKLLTRHCIGRLAYAVREQPVIVPMRYRFHDHLLVMKAQPGGKTKYAPEHQVSFEIDGFDPDGKWGWTVVTSGLALDITDVTDVGSIFDRDLPDWPSGYEQPGHWLTIAVEEFQGRFFGNPPIA